MNLVQASVIFIPSLIAIIAFWEDVR